MTMRQREVSTVNKSSLIRSEFLTLQHRMCGSPQIVNIDNIDTEKFCSIELYTREYLHNFNVCI